MKQPRPRILVFDSGLGGLSIVRELQTLQLEIDLYYLADTAYFPYGEKSDARLIVRVPSIIERGAGACQADLVIIACNTASTLALEQVRASLNIPVIGVVPAIKPAAALTKTNVIGLLATPNTVARPYTDKLISDFAGGVKVIRHGAVGLAGGLNTCWRAEWLILTLSPPALRGCLVRKVGLILMPSSWLVHIIPI